MHVLKYPRFRIGQEFIPDDLDAAVRWGIVVRRRWINFIGALSILDVTPDGNS